MATPEELLRDRDAAIAKAQESMASLSRLLTAENPSVLAESLMMVTWNGHIAQVADAFRTARLWREAVANEPQARTA